MRANLRNGFDPTQLRLLLPALEELLGAADVAVGPEVRQFVLELAGAGDAPLRARQPGDDPVLGLRAVLPVLEQDEAQPLERSAIRLGGDAPDLLAHLVDGLVERLDDVEAVEHQQRPGQVLGDGSGVGLAHVAAGGLDAAALPLAHDLQEEALDGIATLALADPYDVVAVEVVGDRQVAVGASCRRSRLRRGF